jgi:hypothetical protein
MVGVRTHLAREVRTSVTRPFLATRYCPRVIA